MGYLAKVYLLSVLILGFTFATAADFVPVSAAPASGRNQSDARSLGRPEPVDIPQRTGTEPRRRIAMAGVFLTGFIMVLRLGWVRRRSTGQVNQSGAETYTKDP